MPFVTLVIPIYNAERYLRRCLDSVAAQTFQDMEILLMNDGSKDGSLSICREYEQKDARFRTIDKPNTGVSDTRNVAMELASGEYLQFLDSDDWLTPDATESLVQAAKEDDADLVIADFYRVNGKRYVEKTHIKQTSVMGREEFAMEMAKDPADYYYGVMWNKLYRRSILAEHQIRCDVSMNWCEDFLLNLQFIRHAERFRALQKPIYYYMKRKGSLVSTEAVSTEAVKVKFELLEKYKDLYQSMGLYEEHKLKINAYILAVAKDGAASRIHPKSRKLPAKDVIPDKEKPGYQHVEHTFEPVYDENSRILILGTFPSVKSREQHFYYGHPQNRFWKVLAKITGEPLPETIEEKKALLLKHQIAVWDVVQSCDIIGSSDSSIKNVVPADIQKILQKSRISRIYANGEKAYRLYKKYCEKAVGRKIEKLPSTSPANAIFTLERLTDLWREEILHMNYEEVLNAARGNMGPYCKVCPVCDGRACKNQMPGPGAKGVGDNAVRNYQKWQEIRVNMDTIHANVPVDTSTELFGRTFRYPFFAGPIGAMMLHYGEKYDDLTYNNILVQACADAGIAAFTGDGTNEKVMIGATEAIRAAGGAGIPTVKPWNIETIREKMERIKASGAFAVAMDIDAAGLPFLKNLTPPAGSKTTEELKEIAEMAGVPFIVKGIMTPKGALKAAEAGASAIVVSNHGGRVLDQCPATAEVLEQIVQAVEDRVKIFVDGGIRSGVDVFKALALGADGVLICRPFVTAVYGGAAEGVQCYVDKIGAELQDTMAMCGASSIQEITRDMVFRP